MSFQVSAEILKRATQLFQQDPSAIQLVLENYIFTRADSFRGDGKPLAHVEIGGKKFLVFSKTK